MLASQSRIEVNGVSGGQALPTSDAAVATQRLEAPRYDEDQEVRRVLTPRDRHRSRREFIRLATSIKHDLARCLLGVAQLSNPVVGNNASGRCGGERRVKRIERGGQATAARNEPSSDATPHSERFCGVVCDDRCCRHSARQHTSHGVAHRVKP